MSNKIGYGKIAKNLYTKEIQDNLKDSKHLFIAQFSKVSVNSIFDLRKRLRPSKSSFLVVKNSLGRRVLEAGPYKELSGAVEGQCGFGISNDDISKLSKIFVTFSEENPTFKISGAYLDGQIFSSDMVKSLAALPIA